MGIGHPDIDPALKFWRFYAVRVGTRTDSSMKNAEPPTKTEPDLATEPVNLFTKGLRMLWGPTPERQQELNKRRKPARRTPKLDSADAKRKRRD